MSQPPFEQAGSLRIGTVGFVSPDDINVVLDIETPESVALNAGAPLHFPRVNSYLLIPVDDVFLVGQIEWITVENSPFPKRRGMQDFGLIDLPYPLRKLRLNPLGTLRRRSDNEPYVFQRGAAALPTVGAPVMLPTAAQLRAIVESGEQRRVKIGSSALAGDAEVFIDPDRLFGRHLAVLGNTGSGKSCSVAGLIRWSLEQACSATCGVRPNARFIILDPNGEYARAFDHQGPLSAKVFKVQPDECDQQLSVPLWLWNSAEWCSFTQASERTQRPALLQALRFARDGQTNPTEIDGDGMRRFLRTIVATIAIEQNNGSPWGEFPKPKSFFEKLEKWRTGLEEDLGKFEGERKLNLETFVSAIDALCKPRRVQYAHHDFTAPEVRELLRVASETHSAFGGVQSDVVPPDADVPIPFETEMLLRNIEATAELLNVSQYVDTLIIRIRALLNDPQMQRITGNSLETTLEQWLEQHVGSDGTDDACISIVDLSLVPSNVVHIVTAVVARVVFEALQRYTKEYGESLPTVLVMEEAHTFVKRYQDQLEIQDAATVCCRVFERIAREGRKFGLGLVLSSQRPSELSPTVLSQCNSFLLHRISNDRDQELVGRLVPDNLRGLLRELPSLPSQNAILLGWASELPVLVTMNTLPRDHQPRSDDPAFWSVWIRQETRDIDWSAVAANWQDTPWPEKGDLGSQEWRQHDNAEPIIAEVGPQDGSNC